MTYTNIQNRNVPITASTPSERDRFKAYIEQAVEMCDKIGVPYRNIVGFAINYRATARWGCCKYDGTYSAYTCKIEIASVLLNEGRESAIVETILHEICHTINPRAGHRGEWAFWTARLNREFGYNIKRENTCEDKGVEDGALTRNVRVRFEFKCEGCGQHISYTKRCKFVQNYSRYTCGICKGKFVPL